MLNMLLLPANKDVEFGVIYNDKLNCFDFELSPDDPNFNFCSCDHRETELRVADHDNGQFETNNISFEQFDEMVKTGQLYQPDKMLN